MEVERKFLVSEPPDLGGAEADEIEQGYLAIGSDGEVRVRRKGDRLLLTAKRGSGFSRQEAEVELDRSSFDELWPLTEGRRLQKRRHVIPHGDLKIEVDVYEGELEGLDGGRDRASLRGGGEGVRAARSDREEVTGDQRYLNETLATAGSSVGSIPFPSYCYRRSDIAGRQSASICGRKLT